MAQQSQGPLGASKAGRGPGGPMLGADPQMLIRMIELQRKKQANLQSGGQNPNQMMNNPNMMATWARGEMQPYNQNMAVVMHR